jgi:hypothetical protein
VALGDDRPGILDARVGARRVPELGHRVDRQVLPLAARQRQQQSEKD